MKPISLLVIAGIGSILFAALILSLIHFGETHCIQSKGDWWATLPPCSRLTLKLWPQREDIEITIENTSRTNSYSIAILHLPFDPSKP